jgi:hypothetical protein
MCAGAQGISPQLDYKAASQRNGGEDRPALWSPRGYSHPGSLESSEEGASASLVGYEGAVWGTEQVQVRDVGE